MLWISAPHHPFLPENELHVWRARITATANAFGAAEGLLSVDEQVRAESYLRECDRAAFGVARATLRRILGTYLRAQPIAIQLGYSVHGKPYVVGEEVKAGLHFNLSHSGEWAVYAFARGRQVGVDVEQIRPMPDLLAVARHFFAEGEYRALQELTAAQRLESFFACWTRKEAYLKAQGSGLSDSMGGFECSVDSAELARLVADSENPTEVCRWTFRTVDVGPGYAGAVVVEGQPGCVRFFEI